MEFSPHDLRSIAAYIGRRTGLHGELLADAVADGLLALVERGGVDTLREARYFAYIGAVDAYRRREGRGEHPNRRPVRHPESLNEVRGHAVHRDYYPSDDEDLTRILAWAKREPEQTRRIVYYVLQGFTFQDAAVLVGVTPSRVSQRLRGPRPSHYRRNP